MTLSELHNRMNTLLVELDGVHRAIQNHHARLLNDTPIPDAILQSVTSAFEIPVSHPLTRCRTERCATARWCLARILIGLGWNESNVARALKQDPSTVSHGQQALEILLDQPGKLRDMARKALGRKI